MLIMHSDVYGKQVVKVTKAAVAIKIKQHKPLNTAFLSHSPQLKA